MKSTLFLLLGIWLLLYSCSGSTANLINQINQFKTTADSLLTQLKTIDYDKVDKWNQSSTELKQRAKTALQNDTLTFAFAKKLDGYIRANETISKLKTEINTCKSIVSATKKRIFTLKKDIENEAGARQNYTKYVQAEKKEIRSLKNQTNRLMRNFETSIQTLEQYHAELERFIDKHETITQP